MYILNPINQESKAPTQCKKICQRELKSKFFFLNSDDIRESII